MIVSGHHEPAFTVASFATTTHSRPSTMPMPVTTPGAGRLAIVVIVGDEQADLEEVRVGVAELGDALAGGELSLLVLAARSCRARRPRGAGLRARATSALSSRSRVVTLPARVALRSANQSLMYCTRSAVDVPGPNSLPTPCVCSASMSSFGMMPPPVTRMSSRPCSLEQLADAGEQRHVRAGEDREADHVDVFLDGRAGDHLRRLVQAGVDDFHAGVTQRGGDDLGAAVVAIEAGLGDEHADGTHEEQVLGTGREAWKRQTTRTRRWDQPA